MSWFVFAIASLIPFYWVRFMVFGIPTNLLELTVWVLAVIKLGFILGRGEWQRPRRAFELLKASRLFLPIILTLLGLLIGLIVTPDKRTALGIMKTWFLTPGLALVIGLEVIETTRELWWRLIRGLELAGLISAVFGLLQWVNLKFSIFNFQFLLPYQRAHLAEFQPYLETGRIFGLTESPNFLAMILAPTLILFLVDLAAHLKAGKRALIGLLIIIGLLVTALTFFLTRSVGGLIGLVAAFLVLALMWLRYRYRLSTRRLAWAAGMSLMLSGAILIGLKDILPLKSLRLESSLVIRQEIWGVSLAMAREQSLFGVGLGNFQTAFRNATRNRPDFPVEIAALAVQPHSLYLAFLLNLGLAGLIGFLFLLLMLGRLAAQEFDRLPLVVAAGSAALTTQLAHGLIDTTYWKADLSMIFWLLALIVILSPHLAREELRPAYR